MSVKTWGHVFVSIAFFFHEEILLYMYVEFPSVGDVDGQYGQFKSFSSPISLRRDRCLQIPAFVFLRRVYIYMHIVHFGKLIRSPVCIS